MKYKLKKEVRQIFIKHFWELEKPYKFWREKGIMETSLEKVVLVEVIKGAVDITGTESRINQWESSKGSQLFFTIKINGTSHNQHDFLTSEKEFSNILNKIEKSVSIDIMHRISNLK